MTELRFPRRAALLGGAALAYHGGAAEAQDTPRRGGTVTVQVATDPRFLMPALRGNFSITNLAAKVVEPLVDLDSEGQPQGRLATSWEGTPDGLAITFRLRDGVKWHDGRPFTSADVQFSAMEMWRRVQNYGTIVFRNLVAVDTPDPLTAIFRFSKPMPLRLMLYAGTELSYVAPRHLYEGTDFLANPVNMAPIGTGPFRFVNYTAGQHVIVERNPDYWDAGKPYLDRIITRFIADPAAAAAAVESGAVDMSIFSSLPRTDLVRLGREARFRVSQKGNEANSIGNTLCFNHRKPELQDVRVRRAFAHAIDVNFYVRSFLLGLGRRGLGLQPSFSAFYFPDLTDYPFDPRRAEALLDEAGFRRGQGGIRLTLRMTSTNGDDAVRFATFVQQSLARIGVRLSITTYDSAGYLANVMRDWNFDLTGETIGFRNDPQISTTVFLRSGQPRGVPWSNQWGWESAPMDALIDGAAEAVDPDRRRALYRELGEMVMQELPMWLAIEQVYTSVTAVKLRNDHNNPRWTGSHWSDLWIAA
ncbi:ABC transporter substrate-binding protein [Falsiroseomonas stagni]|uniref:Peptide/nickel transport system substrate-binding protein n=1 Tax=Falsiroseomonas stagni DSM 19981 TaxID=1123062 RepID=A0A1I4DM10_9PROT|nr:ABC transporter substrate-binding protein [Falsiroseomonas stagni]SFK94648.1 peptide/nickel transport system substrate-binding protein [Falsiroseomonas stagni DSM 19981]